MGGILPKKELVYFSEALANTDSRISKSFLNPHASRTDVWKVWFSMDGYDYCAYFCNYDVKHFENGDRIDLFFNDGGFVQEHDFHHYLSMLLLYVD